MILGIYEDTWYRGRVSQTKAVGIFPVNHVFLKEDDSATKELHEVIKEWSSLIKQHYNVKHSLLQSVQALTIWL